MAERFIPGYLREAQWRDVWDQPIERGAALEWTTLAAIIAQAQSRGWRYRLPALDLPSGDVYFVNRNSLPRHYGARPGHAPSSANHEDLAQRYLHAFVPKAVLEKGERSISLFREGCAYHEVMRDTDYGERPDIMLVSGMPTSGFPRLQERSGFVEFSFDMANGARLSGSVRPINSPRPTLVDRQPLHGIDVPVTGLVECSVHKTPEVARAQIEAYSKIFAHNGEVPKAVLVTGNDLSDLPWPHAYVPLSSRDLGAVEDAFRVAANVVLSVIGIA